MGERLFVQQVLAPHLSRLGVIADAAFFGHPRIRPAGGITKWIGAKGVQTELARAVQQSTRTYPLFVTTMVDYYALPQDWPSRDTASSLAPLKRSDAVEGSMRKQLEASLGDDWRIDRFIPYVCLHEFESLILAKPEALLGEFPGGEAAIERLKADIGLTPPEQVNDGSETAPSKRIIRQFPQYERHKGISAVSTLRAIGLDTARAACPHFHNWLSRLERLGQEN